MNDDIVIRINGLWKRYGLPLPGVVRKVGDWVCRVRGDQKSSAAGSGASRDRSWALRDINLEVRRGETLGIIGRNGAGKSTLLKVLAGVTPPTMGQVETQGRVFPMIELNAGLHMELTGRENVRLLGAIMGFTRKEIERKMPLIEDFCELGEWLERPVRTYSSGMLTRLGFSVAVSVDAELLLVDEVLAVGDLSFQRKCYRHIEQMRKSHVTTVFVSHAIRQVERLCSEVILLDRGEIVERGDPVEVCQHYMQTVTAGAARPERGVLSDTLGEATWEGSGEVLITEVETLDPAGEPSETFPACGPLRLRFAYDAQTVIKDPIIGVAIYTADMLLLSAFSDEKASIGMTMEGDGRFECEIPSLPLLPGVYSIGVTIKGRDSSLIYKGLHLTRLNVDYSARVRQSRGFIHLEPHWRFTPEKIL
jgi:lipopolysaccharide transport system ATP-binding protein